MKNIDAEIYIKSSRRNERNTKSKAIQQLQNINELTKNK